MSSVPSTGTDIYYTLDHRNYEIVRNGVLVGFAQCPLGETAQRLYREAIFGPVPADVTRPRYGIELSKAFRVDTHRGQ
jgi:hypothetical protein